MRLYVLGNSHAWTLLGWDEHAGTHESVRIESTVDDLDLIGIAVTGATAHNLIEDTSSTGGGPKARALLDSDPDPAKRVLAVFGDVDLRSHVRGEGMLASTLSRYLSFLESIAARPDVTRLLVSSVTGHHAVLVDRAEDVARWNALLERACLDRGWTYVDLFTPGEGMAQLNGLSHENHLEPGAQVPLLAAVRRSLRQGERTQHAEQ